uniref:Uncharacterized protein n=1 Tax=Mycena chlorophos TaxID=658473 RepID=A0ABQ0LK96_MYCCL|nr:predicted protein [Mycena chlorophos]
MHESPGCLAQQQRTSSPIPAPQPLVEYARLQLFSLANRPQRTLRSPSFLLSCADHHHKRHDVVRSNGAEADKRRARMKQEPAPHVLLAQFLHRPSAVPSRTHPVLVEDAACAASDGTFLCFDPKAQARQCAAAGVGPSNPAHYRETVKRARIPACSDMEVVQRTSTRDQSMHSGSSPTHFQHTKFPHATPKSSLAASPLPITPARNVYVRRISLPSCNCRLQSPLPDSAIVTCGHPVVTALHLTVHYVDRSPQHSNRGPYDYIPTRDSTRTGRSTRITDPEDARLRFQRFLRKCKRRVSGWYRGQEDTERGTNNSVPLYGRRRRASTAARPMHIQFMKACGVAVLHASAPMAIRSRARLLSTALATSSRPIVPFISRHYLSRQLKHIRRPSTSPSSSSPTALDESTSFASRHGAPLDGEQHPERACRVVSLMISLNTVAPRCAPDLVLAYETPFRAPWRSGSVPIPASRVWRPNLPESSAIASSPSLITSIQRPRTRNRAPEPPTSYPKSVSRFGSHVTLSYRPRLPG